MPKLKDVLTVTVPADLTPNVDSVRTKASLTRRQMVDYRVDVCAFPYLIITFFLLVVSPVVFNRIIPAVNLV